MRKLINQLKQDEDFRSKPYFCTSGKLTIGYGRNIEDRGISEKEAECLLVNDIKSARIDCEVVFPNFDCYVKDVRYALINMMFNLGMPKFLGFKNMIRAVKEEAWSKAADEVLNSRYAEQVGDRAERIARDLRNAGRRNGSK